MVAIPDGPTHRHLDTNKKIEIYYYIFHYALMIRVQDLPQDCEIVWIWSRITKSFGLAVGSTDRRSLRILASRWAG
jgi:hypothetical protein